MRNFIFFNTVVIISSIICGQVQSQIVTEFKNTSLGFSTNTNVTIPAPKAARLADIDGDGDLDALIANGNTGFSSSGTGFSVMLNVGNGRYGTAVQYTTGFESWDIVVADFTGEGNPDVVVSNTGSYYSGNSVSLFPGNGDGTFGQKTNYPVNSGPIGLATADFNLDGFADLAVANFGNNGSGTTVSVLINNASGGFLPAQSFAAGDGPYKLQAGLIDDDNLPDIVVANEEEKITVLQNTGSGFTPTTYVMQTMIYNNFYPSLQLADIDNDDDLDIFYSSFGTQQISMRMNLGNGVLASAELIVLDGWYGGAASFEIVDLNGDNLKDILATASTGSTGDGYRYVLNQGNGTFGSEKTGSGGQYTFVVMAGDVDLDSDVDILTVDFYSNELTVHPNDGTGNFPVPIIHSVGIPSLSNKLEAADIDNDGDLDIATSANSRTAINTPVAVAKNNGNGSFSSAVIYSSPGLGGVGVKLRDLDNDGFVDLLWASGINTTPYDFFTARNNGNGSFASPVRWDMNSCGWNDIDAADLDNDGDLDVVITEWLGCPSVPFSGSRIFISYNDGDGNFSAPHIKTVNPHPGPIAICDFNEDGFLDLATGQSTAIDISLNEGTGEFLVPASFSMSQSPFDILAADLNADGHSDIASCNYGSEPGDYNLTVRLGNGNGTFQNLQLLDAAYSPDLANVSGISAGDVDNDGDIDLMVSQNATNDMTIYLNDGLGAFSIDHRLCVYYGFSSPWFADFTGDGIGDLAGLVSLPPSGMGSGLTILEGLTTGSSTGGAGLSGCGTTVATGFYENSIEQSDDIRIIPNPVISNAILHINFSSPGNTSVSIYNLLGEKIKTVFTGNLNSGPNKMEMDLSDLINGVYFCKIDASGYYHTLKFIKK